MTSQEPAPTDETADEEAPPEEPADPITALEQERDQYKALAQRTQADFVNFKRRTDEERSLLARSASNQVLARLLPVLDDLQRAVAALPEDAPESWRDGVKMVHQSLHAVVRAEGISMFEPAPGDTFDPAEHEAVYYQPTADQPPGAVLAVVRPGYRSVDRVVRPAQVAVARELE